MFFLFVNKLFNVRNKKTKKRRGPLLSYLEVLEIPICQNKKSPRYARGRFPLILLAYNLKFSRFQDTKNKQKRFFMSLKITIAKVGKLFLSTKDFLANFGFPLAKVAKTQRLFHVSREFTRIFWNELWLLAIGF